MVLKIINLTVDYRYANLIVRQLLITSLCFYNQCIMLWLVKALTISIKKITYLVNQTYLVMKIDIYRSL